MHKLYQLSISVLQNQVSPNDDEILQMFHHYDQVSYMLHILFMLQSQMLGIIKVLTSNMRTGIRVFKIYIRLRINTKIF